MQYDVIIAGAGFAGLAAAGELCGKRVLLIDRFEIGSRPRTPMKKLTPP